jgi:hypothetical protein
MEFYLFTEICGHQKGEFIRKILINKDLGRFKGLKESYAEMFLEPPRRFEWVKCDYLCLQRQRRKLSMGHALLQNARKTRKSLILSVLRIESGAFEFVFGNYSGRISSDCSR